MIVIISHIINYCIIKYKINEDSPPSLLQFTGSFSSYL